METYKTSEVAKLIGIHPNTVRLYEELNLIPKPDRLPNGYRIFTELHIEHFKLVRTALRVEVLQNGLRKQAVAIVKAAAVQDYDRALELTEEYIEKIQFEKKQAEEAINIVERILSEDNREDQSICFTRKETADYLNISMDTLRNWELNGLLAVKRRSNYYRVYTDTDIKRLKIIRSLRCANYSLSAILRLLNELSQDEKIDIREVIDTPKGDDDIVSICDKLLTSLQGAELNVRALYSQLNYIKKEYSHNPPL